MTKDLFSEHAEAYAKYRPVYPSQLFEYILGFVRERKAAWDCATGNGQAASILAFYFEKVTASDISTEQLNNAIHKPNIKYIVAPAEQTDFPDNSFDLITVAQAYHWLNWENFYREATRVGKPSAVVAVWTYNLVRSQEEALNRIIEHFYRDITGPYWDSARKYVEEGYRSVPFDFAPLPSKTFTIELTYTKDQFLGYLSTWSGARSYYKQTGKSPFPLITEDLNRLWPGNEAKPFYFPVALRMGRIIK
jgi:ubiquinone/menaquinone biosynthesis C-methylase UbiE